MKIVITKEQAFAIQATLKELDKRNDVKEFDVLYNPLMPKEFMVRYKSFYVTEDGGINIEIKYVCVNRQGDKNDCQDMFGERLYNVFRDYTVIKLTNPSIEVI
jgi:hypothetical protein